MEVKIKNQNNKLFLFYQIKSETTKINKLVPQDKK